MEPGFFTGKKPRFLILEDGTRQEVSTWTGVAAAVLTYYNRDPVRHRALMALRGRVRGARRILLGSSGEGMRRPARISRNLFLETHGSAEGLMRLLTTRILDAAGCPYGNVRVAIRPVPENHSQGTV